MEDQLDMQSTPLIAEVIEASPLKLDSTNGGQQSAFSVDDGPLSTGLVVDTNEGGQQYKEEPPSHFPVQGAIPFPPPTQESKTADLNASIRPNNRLVALPGTRSMSSLAKGPNPIHTDTVRTPSGRGFVTGGGGEDGESENGQNVSLVNARAGIVQNGEPENDGAATAPVKPAPNTGSVENEGNQVDTATIASPPDTPGNPEAPSVADPPAATPAVTPIDISKLLGTVVKGLTHGHLGIKHINKDHLSLNDGFLGVDVSTLTKSASATVKGVAPRYMPVMMSYFTEHETDFNVEQLRKWEEFISEIEEAAGDDKNLRKLITSNVDTIVRGFTKETYVRIMSLQRLARHMNGYNAKNDVKRLFDYVHECVVNRMAVLLEEYEGDFIARSQFVNDGRA